LIFTPGIRKYFQYDRIATICKIFDDKIAAMEASEEIGARFSSVLGRWREFTLLD
jgi:hypothetical protein